MSHLISLLESFSLIILPFLILIPTTFSQESALLNKICTTTSQNFTDGSPYAKNVKLLLDDLVTKTPQNQYLFRKDSIENTIYGLALCRGDVSADDCDFCLYDARCKITQRCYKKSAIVWYDYCQLRYSDVNFFGKVDHSNDNVLYNVDNMTDNSRKRFQDESLWLLGNLSVHASDKNNKHMFARGNIVFNQTANVKIYGMAQCTLDLSRKTCKTCLDDAVKELPIYYGPQEIYTVGGRVLGESCAVRYEIYAFLNGNNKKAGV